MKTFFHRAINILILAVFVFGQLQPTAALQDKKQAADTASPSSAKAVGRYIAKAHRQAQGGAPAEKSSNLPSNTPAVNKRLAFIDTAGAARLSLRLSALPRFVTGSGPVLIRWKIGGALRQSQALSLQVKLPEGYEPGAGLQSAYDAATRVLTFPVSTAGGQFVLNAKEPAGDAVFSAALFSGSQALAETSLVLPRHETFNARKGGSVFSAENGKIRVEIPGAALPEDAIINIGSPVDEAMPEYSLSGKPFEINATGAQSKKDLHRFSGDISITVDYSGLDVPAGSEDQLYLYWYNPDTKEWEALPSHVDRQSKTIDAVTDHFTVFDIGINNWQATHLPTVDAFQVSNFTGAGTYSLPIEVPPGPGGFQPNLALSYNSQVVDQSSMMAQASWVGMGWSLETGSIERNTQGGTFMLNVAGISALIVKDTSGVYHSADENFMKFSFDTVANTWTVWDKSGNTYFFERPARTRYNTTAPDGSHCGSTWLTYKWSLTRIRNVFGQELAYNYADETKRIAFDGYSTSKQKCITADLQTVTTATFPVSITYPGGRTRLRFEREARADYPSGWAADGAFHVFGRTRLKNVYVEQDANGDGTFETVIRRYDLLYAANDAPDIIWPGIAWSAGDKTLTLREVRQYGLGGTQSLPSTTFTYGDNLHLTRAENGYGGAVEFDYDRWVYEPNGRLSQKAIVKFGAAGQPCETGHFTVRSGYLTCIANGGVPNQLGVNGVAINTYMINPSLGSNMMRPGGTYLIEGLAGYGPHITTVSLGLYDGSVDTFGAPNDGTAVVSLPVTASRADVLVQAIQNGGATIEYAVFHNVSIRLLPSFYRVTQKRLYDGQGNTYPFSYDYQGPAVNDSVTSPGSCTDAQLLANPPTCKQYVEKYSEFRGHSQVTETGPDGRQAVTTFNQDDVLKGRPSSVTVKDSNGNVLIQQSTTYASTTLTLASLGVNYVGFGHSWIRTASEESRIYDANGATYNATQTTYTYEATYGNLTGKAESSWNGSGWDLYRTTRIDTFPYNSAGLYLTGLPARQQVLDANNNVLAEALNIYDANSTYNTAPTAGRLSATRIWVQANNYSQASFGYDAWGNRTSVTAYTAYGTASSAPASGARTVTTAFDSTYHTYPISETDPLIGQAYTWTFDTALGLPLSETDANGQTISATYDAFGRLTQLVRPGDDSAHPTIQATYNDTLSPFRIDLQQRIEGDTYYVIRNTYDGLGRKFKTETGSSVDGTFSLYNTMLATFNAYGKPLSQSVPFGPGETPFYATTTYDALGRPLTVTTPDGANAGYSYDGLTTSVTDANNHTTGTAMDVWGRTVSVTPPAGPSVSYQYDPLNRLVTAVRGPSSTVITYDNAGRKTAMSDPDMGSWSYAYDALGALVSQTDARGCTLGLSYDMLGRLTGKSSSGSGCGTQVNTAYTYDAGAYGKGRRTGMTDTSGSTTWSYDTRGRVVSESKTIDSQSFVTAFTYNSADLPVTMTYPDGEVVTNTYTPQMLLQSVSGADPSTGSGTNYVTDTSYDSAGRITSRALGNGTQTGYSYYAWDQQGGRLATLTTSRLADQATLQNLAYSYDAIGNINTITDTVAGETQSFGYDALDRLVSASATGGPAPYSESYEYDPLTGNLAAKAGVTYTYDVDHPHAVSSLSNGNSYEYDANGNQTTRVVNGQTFQLFYDAEGRLVKVVNLDPHTAPPTATGTPTETLVPTDTPVPTETLTPTETNTPDPAQTETATPTPTSTPSDLPPSTETALGGQQPGSGLSLVAFKQVYAADPLDTDTPTPSPMVTETDISSPQETPTATETPTISPTETTIQTSTITKTPTPIATESNDAYTKVMLHMDGADGATTFSDASGKAWTRAGNAQIDTAQSKYGGTSGLFDGNGDYIYTADSDDFAFGSGDFTIDFWTRLNALPASGNIFRYYSQAPDTNNRVMIALSNTAGTYSWQFHVVQNSAYVIQVERNTSIATNTWYHIAFVRSGNDFLVFQDGVQIGATVTDTAAVPNFTAGVYIAANSTGIVNFVNGWIDEYRVSKGIARWTSNFTPPGPTPTVAPTSTRTATPTSTPAPTQTATPLPPQAVTMTFTYDGDGRMVKATINGVTTLYAGAHFEVTSPGAGQTVAKYYFAGASRVAMRKYAIPQSMALEYFLGDHLGSTSLTTDATGAKISEMRYTPWGELRYSWTDPNLNTTPAYELPDYTYTGQRSYTADFGLMFYNARWYDPALGRFAQADSMISDAIQGMDRYAYVGNNPIKYLDPTGHFTDDALKDYLKSLPGAYNTNGFPGRNLWEIDWENWQKDTNWMKILRAAHAGDVIAYIDANNKLHYYKFLGEGETKLTGVVEVTNLKGDKTVDNAPHMQVDDLRTNYYYLDDPHEAGLWRVENGHLTLVAHADPYVTVENHTVTGEDVYSRDVAFSVTVGGVMIPADAFFAFLISTIVTVSESPVDTATGFVAGNENFMIQRGLSCEYLVGIYSGGNITINTNQVPTRSC